MSSSSETHKKRRVLVLGGGSDIAQAHIRAMAADGPLYVVLAGRAGGSRDSAAEVLSKDLENIEVSVEDFDGADSQHHGENIVAISQRHGGFDMVVVAFGVLGDPFTIDEDPNQVARLMHINATGACSATLASLNILRGVPDAKLIVISSITAVRPRIGNLAYGAAKSALDAFASELIAPAKKVGVDIVVVRPGFVDSAMTEGLEPGPFATTPEAVAADIVKAVEDGKNVIHSPPVLNAVGKVLSNLPTPIWRIISNR